MDDYIKIKPRNVYKGKKSTTKTSGRNPDKNFQGGIFHLKKNNNNQVQFSDYI